MLKKITKYLAKKLLTEDDFGVLMVESIEATRMSPEEEELVFSDLKKIDGVQELLTNTMASDIKRYFAAMTPMEQLQIKGAYNRTNWLRSKIRNDKRENVAKPVKLESPRTA